jgi:hypothetical protein
MIQGPAVAVAWTTVEEAQAHFNEATQSIWTPRQKRTSIKRVRGETVMLRCLRNKDVRCGAKIALFRPIHSDLFAVDYAKTVFGHTGHSTDKYQRFDTDTDNRLNRGNVLLQEDLTSERARYALVPDVPGMRPDAAADEAYILPGFQGRRCRRRLFRPVHNIESAALFEQVLREEDRAYFDWWWWQQEAAGSSGATVFLRVTGVSAVEVQRSLMRAHRMHGVLSREGNKMDDSGAKRHAVFSSPDNPGGEALLAINMFALRAYRMVSMLWLDSAAAMPMAPVLMQAWGMQAVPESESRTRSFGIYSTLLFLQNTLGCNYSQLEQHMYAVGEPGFEIYDLLPSFISIWGRTTQELRQFLHMCIHVEYPSNVSLCSFIAGFIFQKHRHVIITRQLDYMWSVFAEEPKLRKRYPEAWRILDHLRGSCLLNFSVHANILDLSANEKARNPLPLPVPYYLYQVCINADGLLTTEQQWNLSNAIFLSQVYPVQPQHSYNTQYQNEPAMRTYVTTLARRSTDKLASAMRPYSFAPNDLWPLNPMFSVLRALDHHRHRGPFMRLYNHELFSNVPVGVVDGHLRVPDPVAFARFYANLPIARYAMREPHEEGLPDMAYLDDSLWVWHKQSVKSSIGGGEDEDDMEEDDIDQPMEMVNSVLEEARLLVRDPAFYMQ